MAHGSFQTSGDIQYLPRRRRGAGAASGASGITLSNNSISAAAGIGSLVGVLAVPGGTGTYTFTLTSNPGGLFAISGSNLNVGAALSAGSDPITVHADNGAGSVFNTNFTILVTSAAGYSPTYYFLGF